jgi:hypothetical protein
MLFISVASHTNFQTYLLTIFHLLYTYSVQLLKARKPNAPQDWLNKLPQMAKRLEDTLYRTAPTFAAYNDASTLTQRLQQLAMRMKHPKHHQ